MENVENLTRLKYEQDRVLRSNEEARKVREKLKNDYHTLQKRLETLPDNISEDVMVPVGKVAFFPGKLIHTNEVMVLLGDNWFVERSAKQAIEIIQRRLKLVEQQLAELKKEEKNITAQKWYTDDFQKVKEEVSGIKEIQEELPKDEEVGTKKGRSRKAHVAKHDQVPRSVKFKESDQMNDLPHELVRSNSDTIDHDELFARLNELEREEQAEEDRLHEEHMADILSGNYTPTRSKDAPSQDDETTRRHVKFKHDVKNVSTVSPDSDDDDVDERKVSTGENFINFTHTPKAPPQRERSASESDLRNTIKTPADLYDHFASKASKSFEEVYPEKQPALKSILKKDSRSNSNENLERKLRPILKTSPEHQPGTPEQVSFDHDRRTILKTPPDSQGSERRPGTPEYLLTDDPKPILKSNMLMNGMSDSDGGDPRPILKSMDPYLDDEDISSDSDDDMPTILKTSNENIRFNENLRHNGKSAPDGSTRKTILKNTNSETTTGAEDRIRASSNGVGGVKEKVVEKTNPETSNCSPSNNPTTSKRPVSRFKASRSASKK